MEWFNNPDVMARFSLEELKEMSKNLVELMQPFIEYDCETTSLTQKDVTVREPEKPSKATKKAKDKARVFYID